MNQLKAGAILSYLSITITIIISLVYTPVMIRMLGQAEYGLYSLIGSIAAYLSIMDLGLGNAIVRYTSRNRAIGDKNAESNLNGLFLILYTIIGFLTIIVGSIIYFNIELIFKTSLSTSELEKAKIMVIILIINFSLSFPLSVFSSIVRAYERFIVDKVVSIVRSILGPVFILPLLFMGYGSISMVICTTIINIACLLFNVYYCFRNIKVNFYFGKIDFDLLREIIGYSFFILLGIIVDQVNWSTGQFLLGILIGTVPVAVYAIAMQFIRLYIQFSTSISGLLLPKATMLVANNASNKTLTDLMIKFGRVQYIIMSYILAGFIVFGKGFINIWAGIDYTDAYLIVLIIMIPLTIPLIQNVGLSILWAKNLQGFRSIVLIIIAILNIIISIPLINNYGGIGAAIGTSLSLTVGNSLIMNVYYHRKLKINIISFWKNIIKMSIPVVFSILIGLFLSVYIKSENILILLFLMFIFTIIHFSLMSKFGFNDYEKDLFTTVFKKIGKKTKNFRKHRGK
ncbi:oligosaccharide flippase family protein [Niallia sp. FSL M8-0099]|uniref:oligosaccharide flippase family protein n=1 Tax=Niallia sp. FSL M8-0099 TaxID=2954519 RepID=UPI0030F99FE0